MPHLVRLCAELLHRENVDQSGRDDVTRCSGVCCVNFRECKERNPFWQKGGYRGFCFHFPNKGSGQAPPGKSSPPASLSQKRRFIMTRAAAACQLRVCSINKYICQQKNIWIARYNLITRRRRATSWKKQTQRVSLATKGDLSCPLLHRLRPTLRSRKPASAKPAASTSFPLALYRIAAATAPPAMRKIGMGGLPLNISFASVPLSCSPMLLTIPSPGCSKSHC